MCKRKYAVAATLIQNKNIGTINIITHINIVEAINYNEAIGIYINQLSNEFPEHSIHVKPVYKTINN